MDYTIPWHLLSEDDADFFEQAEIECGPSYLKFHRNLSRQEAALLCERLWHFRSIVPEPEENFINFAIGQALNEYSRLFGPEDRDHFLKEWERLSKLRDNTHRLTGAALIYLQTIEHQIRGCCALLNLKGVKLTIDDFQSGDRKRRRQTLGQLKNALLDACAFSEEFGGDFGRFVDARNEFVHVLWTGDTDVDERTGLPTESYLTEKREFTFSLIRQTREMEVVFRGLLATILKSVSKEHEDEDVVVPWKKYISSFNDKLRKP